MDNMHFFQKKLNGFSIVSPQKQPASDDCASHILHRPTTKARAQPVGKHGLQPDQTDPVVFLLQHGHCSRSFLYDRQWSSANSNFLTQKQGFSADISSK